MSRAFRGDPAWSPDPSRLGRRDPSLRPYAPLRVTPRDAARLVGVAVVASGVFWLVLDLGGARLPYPLLLGGSLAVLVALRLVQAVHGPPSAPPLPLAAADPRPADRPFVDAALWEDRLAWADGDAGQFDRTVRPVLARLADERLRQRHGVRLHGALRRGTPRGGAPRGGAPRAGTSEQVPPARRLLGDDVWTLLTTPTATPLSPYELDRLLTRLEQV